MIAVNCSIPGLTAKKSEQSKFALNRAFGQANFHTKRFIQEVF